MAGFFADIDHADDHRRKRAARFQRLHDRFAFLDPVVHLRNGVAITVLPAVSRVIFKACKMGTPLVTSVPRVRAKREIAVLRVRSPKSGTRNLNLIDASAPAGVRATNL